MTSVGLPLSVLMGIAFAGGLIVAWTIALVNSWANGISSRTNAQGARRWGNNWTNDADVPPNKPNSPANNSATNKPSNKSTNKPPTQISDTVDYPAAPPMDQPKTSTTNPPPSPRVSMRDSQKIAADAPSTPQPVKEKRPPSQEPDWIDESEDEWEEAYDDDWDDEEIDEEIEDPDTIPYGGNRSNGKSGKAKRPPLQARYIRW